LHSANDSSTTGHPNPDEEVLCPEDLACRRDGTISLIISLSTELSARAQSLELVIDGVQDYAEETINEIIRVSQDGAESTKSEVTKGVFLIIPTM
jgi:chaperonin GroEL (HSP60 family)